MIDTERTTNDGINTDELVLEYKDELYKFCCYLTNNKYHAEEIFQDTWLKVIKYLYKYDVTKSFKNWLFTIAVSVYSDYYKKKNRVINKVLNLFITKNDISEIYNLSSNEYTPEKKIIELEKKN